jgi:23S rRNA (cytidine1920-2'-O)/16S rRNA (cytidine1409-2'-O)-methyltransferase
LTSTKGKPQKERIDERVVRDGLAPSRAKAQALILAGRVFVNEQRVDKAGQAVPKDAQVRVAEPERRYVSRGGEKLAGALDELGLSPAGKLCLDLGASTGGFTDCLLQRGASRVVAVDVGYGQLDTRLRDDPRVRVLERTNARYLTPADVPEAVDLVTVDVSFISATLLLPRIAEVAPRAELLVMVKPQFEVGRERVGKGGVVRDDADRAGAVMGVRAAAEGLGYVARGEAESRLPGPKGNREVFLWLSPAGVESDRSGPH